jgi:3D (Asp-Asp-Asp) domain-containing protein
MLIKAIVTMYTALETCKIPNCIMANGKQVAEGYIACPRNIKLGTKIQIEEIGEYECGDRTNLKYNGRFDIFAGFDKVDYINALKFGKKKLKIIVK